MLRKSAFCFVFLLGAERDASGFTIEPSRTTPTKLTASRHSSSLFASTANDLPKEETDAPIINPSSVFGSPLDESTKRNNKAMVGALKTFLFDVLYKGDTRDRAFARFYALETIARMPYFSYLSVLHLYETLGWWRRANYLKIHFAESWNELHHLLIMEELGGNEQFKDRFVAQHAAFFYYWFVVLAYLVNPTFCYNLNQAVEEHAYETYDTFLNNHKAWLESQPAPAVAQEYYRDGDLYLFDKMHHSSSSNTADQVVRRPKCDTLYDVFVAVRDDEAEHVKTMSYLQEDDSDIA